MKLEYYLIDKNYKHFSKVKYLFEHAFPEEERPPFSILITQKKNKIEAVESNGNFVGFVSSVERGDLLYIFFLAVKKKYRGQGYGSRILEDLLTTYVDKRIFLLAEDPNIKNDNQFERDKRIHFYNQNGLFMTDVKIEEYGVKYVLLSNKTVVSKHDFLLVMQYLLDDYYPIYLANVK